MAALVELIGASAGYGGQAVLHDLDLKIEAGERIAVMGRSGAGKSTLLNLLYDRLAERVALIPQGAALVKTLSVYHNVYMGRLDRRSTWRNLRNLVWPAREDLSEIERVLDLVGMADKLFAKAGALSGGQQQRTSVARALYNGRPIIIGDEPVSALDHSDRVIVLEDGRIALDTPARALTPADLVPYYGG